MCIYKIYHHISISVNKELRFLYAGIYIYRFISQRTLYRYTGAHTEEFFDSVYLQIMHLFYKWMFSVRQKTNLCLIIFYV